MEEPAKVLLPLTMELSTLLCEALDSRAPDMADAAHPGWHGRASNAVRSLHHHKGAWLAEQQMLDEIVRLQDLLIRKNAQLLECQKLLGSAFPA